ncbi:MAG: MarR family transcriptional regulator [Gammaproteobacteria bacterium]|nr:MarR family transcriptional regulator [Gammaproteobacteria bacterium]
MATDKRFAGRRGLDCDDALALDPSVPRQPLPPELCQHLGFVLAKAKQELAARLNRLTGEDGLSIRHFGILVLLSRRGAMRQTEVADAMRLDRTTVMKMVDELEAAGFVRRAADPRDRRANALNVTAKGTRWIERLGPAALDAERAFLAPLTAQEQDTLRRLLMRLVAPEAR